MKYLKYNIKHTHNTDSNVLVLATKTKWTKVNNKLPFERGAQRIDCFIEWNAFD